MAIAQSKVTAQGQISVPAEVRRKLGIGPGSVLEWDEDGEKIVITPQAPLEQLWVSAEYAGHRFKWNESNWINEKDGTTLQEFLSAVLSRKLDTSVNL